MATAARAAKPRKKAPKGKKQKNQPKSEVRYLVIGLMGVLMALSVYIQGSIGFLGHFISSFMTGMFGIGAFIAPLLIIAYAVYGMFVSARGSRLAAALIIQILTLLLTLLIFMHIATSPGQVELGFWTNLQLLYNLGAASNGGVLGGLFGNLLTSIVGTVGAYIIVVFVTIATLALVSGRSFTKGLVNVWDAAKATFRYDSEEYEYDDYDEDDDEYEEEEYLPAPEKSKTKRGIMGFIGRPKPKNNVLDISEAMHRREDRILLPHEDFDPKHSKVLPFKFEKKEEKRHHIFDLEEPEQEEIIEEVITIEEAAEIIEDEPELPGNIKVIMGGAVYTSKEFEDKIEKNTEMTDEIQEVYEAPKPKAAVAAVPIKSAASTESAFDTSPKYEDYKFPPMELLNKSKNQNPTESRTQILENSRILEDTLRSFKVDAKVVEVSVGPTVTRYDLSPGPGVKVATIANLSNDLALSLAAQGIRIEAPIPGKSAVGIEIPNKEPQSVLLRDILESESFAKFSSALAFAIGKDIAGNPVVTDISRMPHLLIAGATGAGKSVCINTMIASILYKAHPDEVKLLMVDPKVVELSVYNGIPHLLVPVVTDPKKASDALQWAVGEMEHRYELFAAAGARDLKGYNHYVNHVAENGDGDEQPHTMPQIIIIIDELADLMMTCKGAVEESICRLAQKARAAGIHMVLATQRPSVDVITGLIKANVPSRLAFAVSSGTDSRTVLDMTGAEKLLGKGDMLFLPIGQNKPTRLQGGFISDKEVESMVNFLKAQTVTVYPQELVDKVTSPKIPADDENLDEFFHEATEFLIEKGKGSTSMLQRRFRIGYNRASRLMEDLESRGIVGPEDGVKPRKVLISWEDYQSQF